MDWPDWSPEVWSVVALIGLVIIVGSVIENSLTRIIMLLDRQNDELRGMGDRLNDVELHLSFIRDDVGAIERRDNPPDYDHP